MDNNEKIGIALVGTVLTGVGIYLGFVRKGADSLTWFQRISGKKEEEKAKEEIGGQGGQPAGALPSPTKPKQNQMPLPPVVAPPVPPTPVAKTLSQLIDGKKGTWVNAPADNVAVYYIADNAAFRRYKKGAGIGRVGENLNNGYHKVYEVAGDTSSKGVKLSDQWLKQALKL